MRASLRTLPKDAKRTLSHDAKRYLDRMRDRIVSIRDRTRHLRRWVERFGHIRTLALELYIPQLNDQLHEWRRSLAAATCNLHRDALMNLVRVLYGGRAASALSDLVLFEKPPPKSRAVTWPHIEDVLKELDPGSELSLRLRLMQWTGVRPVQVGRLRREDFFLDEKTPYVVVPKAKGGKLTAIPLVGDGLLIAKQFIEKNAFGPWNTGTANRALGKAADRAGWPPFTTYQIRHTFATELRRTGTDVADIQYLYGHTNPTRRRDTPHRTLRNTLLPSSGWRPLGKEVTEHRIAYIQRFPLIACSASSTSAAHCLAR